MTTPTSSKETITGYGISRPAKGDEYLLLSLTIVRNDLVDTTRPSGKSPEELADAGVIRQEIYRLTVEDAQELSVYLKKAVAASGFLYGVD